MLISALLVGAGCHSGVSYVGDNGKSSFYIAYAKGGAIRSEKGGSMFVQTLKMSNDRLADSDILLLIFDSNNEPLWIKPGCSLVAQDGTEYTPIGFTWHETANSLNLSDMTLTKNVTKFGFDPKSIRWAFIAFRLPPPSSHLTVKGIDGFSHIEFDLK
jgi:hypothetical protein